MVDGDGRMRLMVGFLVLKEPCVDIVVARGTEEVPRTVSLLIGYQRVGQKDCISSF